MKLRVVSLGLVGLGALIMSSVASAQDVAFQRVMANLATLEARIEATRQAARTPTVAIGILTSRGLVHFRGFGAKDGAGGPPPDVDTAFRVGSTAKAVLGALEGMAVDRGQLSWSDRVALLHPDFRMADPQVTADFQIVDLLAQRAGTPAYMLSYMMHLNYPAGDLVRGLQYVQPVTPFRTTFAYQNVPHTVAADIVAPRLGAADWAAALNQELLIPLGMFHASSGHGAFYETPNRATGYQFDVYTGRLQPIRPDYSNINDMVGQQPSGGLNASVGDMARWLQLQLGRGTVDGRQYLRRETVEATWRPLVPVATPGRHLPGSVMSYATGWMVEQTGDERVVWHDGDVEGFKTDIAFLPNHDIGIIALSNLTQSRATSPAVHYFVELALNLAHRDLSAAAAADLAAFLQHERETFTRPANPAPQASGYAGLYDNRQNPVAGAAQIEVTSSGLRFKPLNARLGVRLVPFNGDRFIAEIDLPPLAGYVPQPLWLIDFERDGGGVAALSFVDDDGTTVRFVKRR